MKLTVVGRAPAWTMRRDDPSSSYLVEDGTTAIVMDLGQGALGALAEVRKPESVDAIFVSHLHPDHHADLVALRHYLRFGMKPPGSVRLHGPGELRSRYDAFLGEAGFLDGLPGEDVTASTFSIGSLIVQARPVTHALNSHAFRVTTDGGANGLVYSGDCGQAADLVPLMVAGDTLLCEAFWGTTVAEANVQHLTAIDAAWAARAGRAERLILTHIPDAHDPAGSATAAARSFGGEVLLARPGLQVDIA
ncbi:MAG: MBL fold metallo-hydrolase [Chloroflexi bacterium]|nr:MBL fold metallo-hydrolase [Chloroflexota bacterium]